jgi:hypothetical protein
MASFPERNSVFCPVDYTADFVYEGIPKPRLLFTTVQGNPKPTSDPDTIPDRTWTFVGKALLLKPSETDTTEVQQYTIKYDFTKVDVPVTATASGSLLGTMQLHKGKNVYNANRYMTWKQDSENPRIVYINIRIPSCLLKKNKRTVLDFSVVLNDKIIITNKYTKNDCENICSAKCRPTPFGISLAKCVSHISYTGTFKFSGLTYKNENIFKYCTNCG